MLSKPDSVGLKLREHTALVVRRNFVAVELAVTPEYGHIRLINALFEFVNFLAKSHSGRIRNANRPTDSAHGLLQTKSHNDMQRDRVKNASLARIGTNGRKCSFSFFMGANANANNVTRGNKA